MTPRISAGLLLPVVLGMGLAAAPGWAQEKSAASPKAGAGTYNIDPAHSSVGFQIRHLVSKVPGRFASFQGTLEFDPANLAATKVQVEIDAASINTDHTKRDEHLRSPDFFDVAKFPKITFKSTGVTAVDATRAKLTGDLTMKGITKPVTLDVEILGVGPGAQGETRAGFEARGRINRTDFSVSWNRALEGGGALLGDDVDLVLNVEASKPGTAGAKKG